MTFCRGWFLGRRFFLKKGIETMDIEQASDDLKMLFGLPPHNHPSNICYNDGYFANSLVEKYQMSIKELSEKTGIRKK